MKCNETRAQPPPVTPLSRDSSVQLKSAFTPRRACALLMSTFPLLCTAPIPPLPCGPAHQRSCPRFGIRSGGFEQFASG